MKKKSILNWCLLMFIIFSCNKRPETLGVKDGKLSSCPDKSNCVCSHDTRDKYKVTPFKFMGTKAQSLERLLKVLAKYPSAKIATNSENYLHIEFKSKVFGFVDDVEFYFDEAESLIHVRSASRSGYYDFGVNKKRVGDLKFKYIQF